MFLEVQILGGRVNQSLWLLFFNDLFTEVFKQIFYVLLYSPDFVFSDLFFFSSPFQFVKCQVLLNILSWLLIKAWLFCPLCSQTASISATA